MDWIWDVRERISWIRGGGENFGFEIRQTWIQIPLDRLLVVRSWAKYWALFSSLGDIASSLLYYYEDWKKDCQLKSVRFKLWYVLEFFSKFSNIYNFQNGFRKKNLAEFLYPVRGVRTSFSIENDCGNHLDNWVLSGYRFNVVWRTKGHLRFLVLVVLTLL